VGANSGAIDRVREALGDLLGPRAGIRQQIGHVIESTHDRNPGATDNGAVLVGEFLAFISGGIGSGSSCVGLGICHLVTPFRTS
jgi:hypothetical protein